MKFWSSVLCKDKSYVKEVPDLNYIISTLDMRKTHHLCHRDILKPHHHRDPLPGASEVPGCAALITPVGDEVVGSSPSMDVVGLWKDNSGAWAENYQKLSYLSEVQREVFYFF